jgi:hypothetical protein
MARYEHLPIYKKAMDLAIYFEQVVRNFSRYHKYTLGSEVLRFRHSGLDPESSDVVLFPEKSLDTGWSLPRTRYGAGMTPNIGFHIW